jgi:hypothetical protein
MIGKGLHPMMLFKMPLHPLSKEKHGFISCRSKPTFFHDLFFIFFVNELTLFCSVDGIHTLVNGIIINSIWANLVSRATFSLGVAAIVVAQGKERFYRDYYPTNVFFLLLVFGYLHKQIDNFFHRCANVTWTTKNTENLPLSILYALYK